MTPAGRGPAPVHYLRGNDKVWTPPSVIYLDSETTMAQAGTAEVLTLRLWAAKHVDRREVRKTQGPVTWGEGTTPAELTAWVIARCRGRRAVWCYAHNLAFDLCTTALPLHLAAAGWRVTDFSVRSQAPWMRLTDDRTTLTLCDSWSWLPEALGQVAARMGQAKEDLPGEGDPDEMWYRRCRTDVDLLAEAVGGLMNWWDRNRLGRWTVSGPASGWNAFRHIPTAWRTVIDPDPAVLAEDRQAVRGGRRDVARVGDLGDGQWVEVDLADAYPTVAATLPLPYRRGATFDSLPVDHASLCGDRWGVVAEAEVVTDAPRYPLRWGGVTWYPVGRFKTVLAGPELAWAASRGDLVAIGRGRWHQLGWAMAPWAEWCLSVSSGAAADAPPVARLAAKSWGRSVIGKWGSRSQTSERLGFFDDGGWGYTEGIDHGPGLAGALVNIAGQRWFATYGTEGENTYPAILAWVESHVRARLGRVLDWLPRGVWVQCDTDGAILDLGAGYQLVRKGLDLTGRTRDAWGVAAQLCQLAAPLTEPLTLRPKKAHRQLRVMGAQHLVTDLDRRLSGVRRDAVETEAGRFVAHDWPKLRWQMERSVPGQYLRPERVSTIRRPLAHRWLTMDGEAWPPMAYIDGAGANQLATWDASWAGLVDTPLAELQYAGLARLATTEAPPPEG